MELNILSIKVFQAIILGLMIFVLGACEDEDRRSAGGMQAPDAQSCSPQYFQCLDSDSITTRYLAVDGIIRAEEILVETVVPDYVFDTSYDLKPLRSIEDFIGKYQHLPGIQSREAIESTGGTISIGDSYRVLLEKIEELTLYTIDQEKRIEELETSYLSQNK